MGASIDIMNSGVFDKLLPVTSSGSTGSSVLSSVLGSGGNPWVALGANVLGGLLSNRDSSGAQSVGGASQLNTSGWVVGDGEANGGDLSSVPTIPWYVWIAVAGLAYVVLRKKGH